MTPRHIMRGGQRFDVRFATYRRVRVQVRHVRSAGLIRRPPLAQSHMLLRTGYPGTCRPQDGGAAASAGHLNRRRPAGAASGAAGVSLWRARGGAAARRLPRQGGQMSACARAALCKLRTVWGIGSTCNLRQRVWNTMTAFACSIALPTNRLPLAVSIPCAGP